MERLPQMYSPSTASSADSRSLATELWSRCALFLCITIFAVALVACTSEGEDSAKTGDESTTKTSEADATETANSTAATTSEATSAAGGTSSLPSSPITNANPLPALSVTDYVVVSSRRTGRTRTEYTLKIKVANSSSQRYENVMATLVSVPAHITIVDSIVNMDTVPPNAVVLSPDTFIIDVNLAVSTSFEALLWDFEGDVAQPPPPPPPSGGPSAPGIYMNIDDNAIPGESTSASHKDWIELYAFTEGLHRDNLGATGSTRIRSSFVFDGVTADKQLDKSSPKLREAIVDGRFFGEIKIDIIAQCGGSNYTAYAITLSTAQVVDLSLAGGNENPTEEIGLMYGRIETMYTPVASDCTLLSPIYSTQDGALLSL